MTLLVRSSMLGVALASVCVLAAPPARADYPIAAHRYLADPGALVHGGRLYLYNSNDDDNAVEGGYAMRSIVCVSSADLKNWTDHGIVFQVPQNASWANYSWAPYPLERDGTIYLYFGNNANGVGVATSKDPVGPFKDPKGSALVTSSTPGASGTDIWLFDPGALIDEDGQAYLSFGGNGENNARIIKLGSDLTSVSGSATALSPQGFFEASFMFKRNGTYYFAYSSDSAHGLRIDYLTSKSPMSGYTYKGVIADQPPMNNNNNHASEFQFGDKWYHAYHNRSVATAAGISTTYRRNLGLEVLNFKADDSIEQVTYTTDGVPQLGHLDPYARVEAETTNASSGIETEPCMAGGMDVTSIDDGDWVKVRGADFGMAGAKTFTARVASTAAGGKIEVRLGGGTGMLVGTCDVPATGGAQTWMTTTCDVTGATGVSDLTLKFTGGKFNVDSWQFTGGDPGMGMGGAGMGGASGAAGAAGGGMGGSAAGTGAAGGVAGSAGTMSGAGTAGTSPAAGSGTGGTTAQGGSGMTTSGNGGRPGTSGAPAGGSAGSGTGGSTAAGAGAQAAGGGEAPSPSSPAESSGCGCKVAGDASDRGALWTMALSVLGVVSARRRRALRRQN
ncbi:MAG TPA: glycoside hydrolase family 43 protein [Polyangiaceae bacterium]|nr:glycoside hydrolase family 43 protein [Polyangiaceae bacterium]